MNAPTPNPRRLVTCQYNQEPHPLDDECQRVTYAPERQPAYDAVYAAIFRSPASATENARVWRAVEAALDAMDLPARDARIREQTHRDIARQLDTLAADDELISAWTLTCDPVPLTVADWFRALASKLRAPAERAAAGSAVPAEGSGHPPAVGRLPWPHGADPTTDAWLRSQGLNPAEVQDWARREIDTLIRRTGGDDRG